MNEMTSQITNLFNQQFIQAKKPSKLQVTGLCEGNSPVIGEFITGEFPAQRASNAENVSIWWRHHDILILITLMWWGCDGLSWFYHFKYGFILKTSPQSLPGNTSALTSMVYWTQNSFSVGFIVHHMLVTDLKTRVTTVCSFDILLHVQPTRVLLPAHSVATNLQCRHWFWEFRPGNAEPTLEKNLCGKLYGHSIRIERYIW